MRNRQTTDTDEETRKKAGSRETKEYLGLGLLGGFAGSAACLLLVAGFSSTSVDFLSLRFASTSVHGVLSRGADDLDGVSLQQFPDQDMRQILQLRAY